jgi:hypothetical protein
MLASETKQNSLAIDREGLHATTQAQQFAIASMQHLQRNSSSSSSCRLAIAVT